MGRVEWPCEINKEGISGVPFYYWESNKWKFDNPQRFASVDCRLYIALAAAILDGIKFFDLKGINTHGIYCNRNIRGSNKVSTHASGIAIDLKGFLINDSGWWVETPPEVEDRDAHKPMLSITATVLMRPYFPDIITWDKGQWQGGFPHKFSSKTAQLHRDHYHLNVSPKTRFRVTYDKFHNAAVQRLIAELGHKHLDEYQKAKGLVADGIAGLKTSRELVADFGGKVVGG